MEVTIGPRPTVPPTVLEKYSPATQFPCLLGAVQETQNGYQGRLCCNEILQHATWALRGMEGGERVALVTWERVAAGAPVVTGKTTEVLLGMWVWGGPSGQGLKCPLPSHSTQDVAQTGMQAGGEAIRLLSWS